MAGRTETAGAIVGAVIVLASIAYVRYETSSSGRGRGSSTLGEVVPRVTEVVDRDFQFRLARPDPRCHVYTREVSRATWSETVAAMQCWTMATVQVLVERVGPITVEQGGDLIATRIGVEAHRRSLRWVDRDAVELSYTSGGEIVRTRLFVRDGWLFHVVASRLAESGPAPDDVYRRLWGAFTLLDGPLQAPPPAKRVVESDGLDWRVVRGQWQSSAAGLAIQPPPGWRLLTGRMLAASRRDVDVEVLHDATGCVITITSFMMPFVEARDAVVMTADAAGAPRRFVRTSDAGALMITWVGTFPVGATHVRIEGWAPAGVGDVAIDELRRGLAAITELPSAERQALTDELVRHRVDPTDVGSEWALRSGTYVHYAAGLVWRQPARGLWQVVTGVRAGERFDGAILVGDEPRLGLTFAVVPDAHALDPGPARWLADNVAEPIGDVDMSAANPSLARGAETGWTTNGRSVVYRLVPLVANGQAFRVHVVGVAVQVRAHEREVTEAVAGLQVRSVLTPEERPDGFVDLRLGHEVRLPGWSRTDHGFSAGMVDRIWEKADAMIGVRVEVLIGPDRTTTLAFGRRRASAAAEAGTAAEPRQTFDTIAGETAARWSWYEGPTLVTVSVVDHKDMLFTIWTRGTAKTLALAKLAFSFIDAPD